MGLGTGLYGDRSTLGTIRFGDDLASQAGDFWGVRDARSDTALNWSEFAGGYSSMFITEAGEIGGNIDGCAIYGAANDAASDSVSLTLSGFETCYTYSGVFDLPVNDNDEPSRLIAGSTSGWRLER